MKMKLFMIRKKVFFWKNSKSALFPLQDCLFFLAHFQLDQQSWDRFDSNNIQGENGLQDAVSTTTYSPFVWQCELTFSVLSSHLHRLLSANLTNVLSVPFQRGL